MTERDVQIAGGVVAPVVPSRSAISALSPLGAAEARVTGGFWGDRLALNRTVTLGHGFEQLKRAGNIENFRLAAGVPGSYRALGAAQGTIFPFLDSDVYKWLEAVGWELARGRDAGLEQQADEAIAAVAAAQRPDGYLNTYVQVVGGRPYADLAWGHELYCIGHLVQAAVAWHRSIGDDRLLDVALRAVASISKELGPDGRDGVDGHPEIEMALVELFRVTGDRRHLDLATRFIDGRGRGLLGNGRFGAEYWQDHATVRDAKSVAGHAVRQLYLDCGAVDVATERGDHDLLDAVLGRWRDMVATRTYLTGGVGSRHRDEAFGDPYELPPDRAYAETCGAIASVMLAWRLLLATGEPEFADLIERTMFNGVLGGSSLDGACFFYVNPLQRRTSRVGSTHGSGGREPWYPCACCPPNLMRTLSTWPQLLATRTGGGLQIHQLASATFDVAAAGGRAALSVETDYPWEGEVRITFETAPRTPFSLDLRVPAWSTSGSVEVSGEGRRSVGGGMVRLTRKWSAGDTIQLRLDMPVRETLPDPRIDALRGTAALERGPLVYCIESPDLPPGVTVEDVALPENARVEAHPRDDVGARVMGLRVAAVVERGEESDAAWPYHPGIANDGVGRPDGDGRGDRERDVDADVEAIPYFAWANRTPGGMRVWIPRATAVVGPRAESDLEPAPAEASEALLSTGGRRATARRP